MEICKLKESHYPEVAAIYREGLDTGFASFETEVPSWEVWNQKFLATCRFVAVDGQKVIGWAALNPVSKRLVYSGVAENTVYVAASQRSTGIGRKLLNHLVTASEKSGFWTLQAAIFPQNTASLKLHQACGFRVVGLREKIGKRNGEWYDNIFLERRSKKIF